MESEISQLESESQGLVAQGRVEEGEALTSIVLANHLETFCSKVVFYRDFPGGPVVKTPRFHGGGTGSIPSLASSACCMAWPKKTKQNKKASLTYSKGYFLYDQYISV